MVGWSCGFGPVPKQNAEVDGVSHPCGILGNKDKSLSQGSMILLKGTPPGTYLPPTRLFLQKVLSIPSHREVWGPNL